MHSRFLSSATSYQMSHILLPAFAHMCRCTRTRAQTCDGYSMLNQSSRMRRNWSHLPQTTRQFALEFTLYDMPSTRPWVCYCWVFIIHPVPCVSYQIFTCPWLFWLCMLLYLHGQDISLPAAYCTANAWCVWAWDSIVDTLYVDNNSYACKTLTLVYGLKPNTML